MSVLSLEAGPEGWLARLARLRREWLSLEKSARAIAFAQSATGLLFIHVVALAALAASQQVSWPALVLISMTLAAAARWPQRRLQILLISSLVFLFLRPFRTQEFTQLVSELASRTGLEMAHAPLLLQMAGVLTFLLLARGALALQRRGGALFAARPVLFHLTTILTALAIGAFLAPGSLFHAAWWTVLAVWCSCVWFLAYAAMDQKARMAEPDTVRALYMRPVWGGDVAPIGKGLSFLARFEARDPEALAAARLKGLKLAVWAMILSWAYLATAAVLHGALGVPRLGVMIVNPAAVAHLPLGTRWAGLLTNYALDLLIIAAWGHAIVAVVRMMGYAIPRNTVNPMAARSLADFWNRYYYYFKELLVDVFFYPAFVRFFKQSPRLRIAFATFCAAGFGNFLYHLIFAAHVFGRGSPLEQLDRFATLAFYVCFLSAGLIASQLWGRKSRPEDGFWRGQVLPRLHVALFFCFLKIFDSVWLEGDLSDRFAFLFSLFGA